MFVRNESFSFQQRISDLKQVLTLTRTELLNLIEWHREELSKSNTQLENIIKSQSQYFDRILSKVRHG